MRRLLAAALLLALAAPGRAADPVPLKWSLKDGDSFYATTVQDINQTITVMGQNVKQKMSTTTVAKFTVESARGGNLKVKMTYTQVTMEADGALAAPGLGAMAERFKGAELTATFDKNFNLTKLDGYDKFLDRLSDGDDMMRKVFVALMPESAVKVMFVQVFVSAPKDAVAAGDQWDRTDKVPLSGLGNLTNKTQFTVTGFKGDVVTIKTSASVKLEVGEPNDALPFKIVKSNLKSDDVKGVVLFDTKAGRLQSSEQVMKLKGTMTIEVMNQQVDTEIDQVATTRVTVSGRNPVKD